MNAAEHIADLAAFVAASPSSYHAAAEVARRLSAAGFVEQRETEAWQEIGRAHV
jgi:aspartyl aminopeptidase